MKITRKFAIFLGFWCWNFPLFLILYILMRKIYLSILKNGQIPIIKIMIS